MPPVINFIVFPLIGLFSAGLSHTSSEAFYERQSRFNTSVGYVTTGGVSNLYNNTNLVSINSSTSPIYDYPLAVDTFDMVNTANTNQLPNLNSIVNTSFGWYFTLAHFNENQVQDKAYTINYDVSISFSHLFTDDYLDFSVNTYDESNIYIQDFNITLRYYSYSGTSYSLTNRTFTGIKNGDYIYKILSENNNDNGLPPGGIQNMGAFKAYKDLDVPLTDTGFDKFVGLTINVAYSAFPELIAENVNNGNYYQGYLDGFDVGQSTTSQESYDTGYSQGYSEGLRTGEDMANNYTFRRLFGAIADTPILFLRQLLGFDVFGVSAISILMTMITGCLILFVLRKIVL